MKKLLTGLSIGLILDTACGISQAKEATLTPVTPEHILPAGVDTTLSVNPYTGESGQVRKGTVAATINNIAILNRLLQEPLTLQTRENIEKTVKEIQGLLSSLRMVGMFDIFSPLEWISASSQPGRVLAIVLYMEKFPEKLTPEIKEQLGKVNDTSSSSYLSERVGKFLKMAG